MGRTATEVAVRVARAAATVVEAMEAAREEVAARVARAAATVEEVRVRVVAVEAAVREAAKAGAAWAVVREVVATEG